MLNIFTLCESQLLCRLYAQQNTNITKFIGIKNCKVILLLSFTMFITTKVQNVNFKRVIKKFVLLLPKSWVHRVKNFNHFYKFVIIKKHVNYIAGNIASMIKTECLTEVRGWKDKHNTLMGEGIEFGEKE